MSRRTPGGVRPRRGRASWLAALFALVVAAPAIGAERTDVPLKNWGGFAVFRDAVYDDLERLVIAGFADRVVLNTKPMSRLEAARIVARAIRNIRADSAGRYDDRRDLEPVLDRLTAEFRRELTELGVLNGVAPRETFSFVPVDRAQARVGYANRHRSWPNSQGLRFESGFNAGATFETRAQVGDVLSFYAQPEGVGNEEFGSARLATGYAKLTLWNVELAVGRESLWWGPGLNGSLILSNNAPPLDQIRLGSAEAFMLPWIGEWLGPTKLLAFVAQLEERRDHPRALLTGMRGTITPFSFLELGISRTVMSGGETPPQPDFTDYLRTLFDPPAGDERRRNSELRSNNVFAVDGDLRIRHVSRYGLPARDVRLYGEFGWDDTCCNTAFLPLDRAVSALVGAQVIGVFGREGLESRFEYTKTSGLSFVHDQFRSGYWTRGEVISHFVGTEGENLHARVTNRLTPNTMLGLELDRAVIGRTVTGFRGPKERRTGGGIDLSFRFAERYAIFAQYRVADVHNRDFEPGRDGFDHLLGIELTRSFR